MNGKRWWTSRTLWVNVALIVVAGLGLVMDAAQVLELSARTVAVLGVVAGVINVALRLATAQPIAGTAAADRANRERRR